MDWDQCSSRAVLEGAGQLVKAGTVSGCLSSTQQCQAGLPAGAGNCQLRLCMGLAWKAQVECSINKIFLVAKLMELPPHSPEDLTASKKVKVLYSNQRDSIAPAELGYCPWMKGAGDKCQPGLQVECAWRSHCC